MAGYEDTRELIINTLMGRPAGTEIQPEDHQAFALQITEYIRQVELVAGSGVLVAFAEPDTVPVQPDNGQAVYLSSVGGAQTVTFSNFIGQNGSPISVTSTANVIKLVTLLWNGQYWSSQIISVNAIRDTTNGYLFMGVATTSTNPGTPDAKVFYIANGKGTYTNFGGLEVTEDDVVILYWDSSWHKVSTGIASQEKLSKLDTTSFIIDKDLSWIDGELVSIQLTFSSLPTFKRTTPFLLKKGEILSVKTWDYDFVVIAACDSSGQNRRAIKLATRIGETNALQYYHYVATDDIYIIVSLDKSHEFGCEIQDLSTFIDNFFQESIITGVRVEHPINTILPKNAIYAGKYYIQSNGAWAIGDYDSDCLLFPIKTDSKVTIISQPFNRAFIGFVNKSDRPISGHNVIFANGTASRIEIPANTKRVVDVIEDCNLYVYNYPGYYPSSIAVMDSNIDLGIGDTKNRLIAEVVGEKVKFGKWRNDQIKLTIPLEFGFYLSSNGQPKFDVDFYDYKRSVYPIKTNGAKYVDTRNSGVIRVLEYDINGTYIKSTTTNNNVVLLDEVTAYININTSSDINKDNTTILLYDFEIAPFVSKNNLPVNNDLIGIDLGGGIYTTFNLFLATNYSVDGKPSPLVVYFPPDGGFNNILNGVQLPVIERTGVQYLNDEGITVVSVYGWTSYYGIDRPNAGITSSFPTPIVLDCYNKVIESLLAKYNLDRNCVCAMSYSGGGKLCEYFALRDKKFNSLFFCNPTLSLGYAGKSSASFWDWRCILVDQFAMKNIPNGFIEQEDFDMTRNDFVEWMKDNFDVWGNASPNFVNSLRTKDEAITQYMKSVVAWKTYQNEVGGAYPENGYMIDGELVKIYDELERVKIGNGTPSFFILCKGDSQAPWQASRELSFNLCNSGVESKCIFLDGEHKTPTQGATKIVTPLLSSIQTSVPYAWRYIAYTIFMKFFKRELSSTEFGDDIVEI